MKKFDTFQSLWSYCLYCPICKNISRDMEVIVGPEEGLKLVSWSKQDYIVRLDVRYAKKNSPVYRYYVEINGLNNSYDIKNISEHSPDNLNILDFYFYLYANCSDCNSFINSASIDVFFEENKLPLLEVEQEGFDLKLKNKYYFHLTLDYERELMLVYKLYKKDDLYINNGTPCTLPLLNLNWSDANKAINKIKKLLIFS